VPKYFSFKVEGYFLYFTSHCIIEPVHAHASDSKLSERGSAKIWVKENGDTVVANYGAISHRDMAVIRQFIKDNIVSIKRTWADFAGYSEFKD
jgi:hypothetical protein